MNKTGSLWEHPRIKPKGRKERVGINTSGFRFCSAMTGHRNRRRRGVWTGRARGLPLAKALDRGRFAHVG